MNNSCYENGIRIKSVADYVKLVSKLHDEDNNNCEVFFRGQKNSIWSIEPSISRGELLNIEHILMLEPLLISPLEFPNGIDNKIDTMAKLQHYGMCTRLLDVTTNPLVALYFSCEQNVLKYDDRDNELAGAVYYKYDYPANAYDFVVKIILSLSTFDLTKDNTINKVLNKLVTSNVISREQGEKWETNSGIYDFAQKIQSAKTVVTTYSNTRLIAQSGAFLLPGMFNVNINKDSLGQSIITKARQDLRDEFEEQFFYVCESDKEKILAELNLYKINESTLFPELEHQLNYLKLSKKRFAKSVEPFVRLKEIDKLNSDSLFDFVDTIDRNQYLNNIRISITNMFPIFTIDTIDSILSILDSCLVVDWYKRSVMLSKLKYNLKRLLIKDTNYNDTTQSDMEIEALVGMFTAEWISLELKSKNNLYMETHDDKTDS